MGLRLWDFACKACGTRYESYPVTAKRVPHSIKCENCGKRATWTSHKGNLINFTASGMNYGKFDPQFGCVVRDYAHRQRLLREKGMVEVSGPERRDDIEADAPVPTGQRDPNVFVADSIEEIMEQIDTGRIDWKLTGNSRRRDMLPSGGGF